MQAVLAPLFTKGRSVSFRGPPDITSSIRRSQPDGQRRFTNKPYTWLLFPDVNQHRRISVQNTAYLPSLRSSVVSQASDLVFRSLVFDLVQTMSKTTSLYPRAHFDLFSLQILVQNLLPNEKAHQGRHNSKTQHHYPYSSQCIHVCLDNSRFTPSMR